MENIGKSMVSGSVGVHLGCSNAPSYRPRLIYINRDFCWLILLATEVNYGASV